MEKFRQWRKWRRTRDSLYEARRQVDALRHAVEGNAVCPAPVHSLDAPRPSGPETEGQP